MRIGRLLGRRWARSPAHSVLAVTMYYDIGRDDAVRYGRQARTTQDYISYYRSYFSKLPVDRLIVCADPAFLGRNADDFRFICSMPLEDLPAMRCLPRTQEIMKAPGFRARFGGDLRMESVSAIYNIVMLAKMDALEAAYRSDRYDHYAWIDFGIGRRTADDPWLPRPRGFQPRLGDRITVSVDPEAILRDASPASLAARVFGYVEHVAGSFILVPHGLLPWFVAAVRANYRRLLELGLASDDQILFDMCVHDRPDLFRAVAPLRGCNKFSNIHNIITGRA